MELDVYTIQPASAFGRDAATRNTALPAGFLNLFRRVRAFHSRATAYIRSRHMEQHPFGGYRTQNTVTFP